MAVLSLVSRDYAVNLATALKNGFRDTSWGEEDPQANPLLELISPLGGHFSTKITKKTIFHLSTPTLDITPLCMPVSRHYDKVTPSPKAVQ
jgi:hypothetical protein